MVTPEAVAAVVDTTPSWVQVVEAVAWPAVAMVGVLALVFSGSLRRWLIDLTRKIRKVSALGVDVELSPEVAKEVAQLTSEAFHDLRQRVTATVDQLVHVHQINDKRKRLVEDVIRPALGRDGRAPDFRMTIYIDDMLFTESMYQLLDYHPKSSGARGRTYPIRFGIVGRAWRSRQDQMEADVPVEQQALIRDWGMTWDQASSAGQDRRSFACILLFDQTREQVCLLYMDSPQVAAFGETRAE